MKHKPASVDRATAAVWNTLLDSVTTQTGTETQTGTSGKAALLLILNCCGCRVSRCLIDWWIGTLRPSVVMTAMALGTILAVCFFFMIWMLDTSIITYRNTNTHHSLVLRAHNERPVLIPHVVTVLQWLIHEHKRFSPSFPWAAQTSGSRCADWTGTSYRGKSPPSAGHRCELKQDNNIRRRRDIELHLLWK